MKELQVRVGLNSDNKIVTMEPVNKATGKTVESHIVTARLLTQADLDREIREAMQDGVHTYKRVNGRVRQNS